jgi:phospholipid/cholesterol/gamma-HCH transport system ATP-binding protein
MPRRIRPRADKPIIEVQGLAIGWGEVVLQRDLTFDVQRGEVFGILGGSGAGKSTLMRFLIGLEQPLEGEIDIAGCGSPDLEAGLPPFGVMFQAGALFGSLTVGENVALPLEEWTDLPRDAIAAIARALALEPALVFLDEPSAGLDPVMAADLDELVSTLSKSLGLTVVLVTHELASIFRIANRVVMLDKKAKTIIASGDPHELLASADPRVSDFFNRRSTGS